MISRTMFDRAAMVAAISTGFALQAGGQTARVRDSAGVRIVENSSRLKAPVAFTLGAKPNFDVGGLESDPANEISSRQNYFRGIRFSNGHVAVIDRSRIQFFDATGKRLKISGREGRGPGEFMNIVSLCRTRGDTIVAADEVVRRVSFLDGAGEVVASAPYGVNGYADNQFCFDDGTILVRRLLPGDYKLPGTMRLTRLTHDGSVANQVADVPYPAFDMLIDNSPSVGAWGQRVYFGSAMTHDIQVFAADGKLASIIRTDDELTPITNAEREKLQPMATRAGASATEQKAEAARVVAASKTKNWPTYRRLFVDVSGRLWVEDWAPYNPMAADAWTAFDAAGRLLGRLIIPATPSKEKAVKVVQFGRDEVFLQRFDDDGAIHLTAYPLIQK